MNEPLQSHHLIAASASVAGGLLLGFLVYWLVARSLRRNQTMTMWGGDQLLLRALHRVILVWFAVAGIYGAIIALPLKERISDPVNRGLLAIVIISGTLAAGRLAGDMTKLYALRSGGGLRQSSIFVTLSRLFAVVVGLLILLQTLGVSITPLLTALGVGGLAVALALQDTLANLFAGLHLIASKKIRLGDYVALEGIEGYVTDINWRNTTVRMLPGNMNIVPNARMANAIVTNFYRPQQELSILMQVGVAYDSDLEHVERVTIDVAAECQREISGAVRSWEPLVRFHTFNDFSIDFTVVLRAEEFADQHILKHEFVKRLHRRYDAEGIVIPFPIRTVQMEGGQGSANGGRAQPKRAPKRAR